MKVNPQKQIELLKVANNALQKLFEQEMPRVLENLYNGNTQIKKAREINLKLKFMPVDESREVVKMSVGANCKLAPCEDISTNLFVDMDKDGNIFATEINSGQMAGQIGLGDYDEHEEDHSSNDVSEERTETSSAEAVCVSDVVLRSNAYRKVEDISVYKNKFKAQ